MRCSRWVSIACMSFAVALAAAPRLGAQDVAPDADRTAWSPRPPVRPNGTHEGRPAFLVRGLVRWTDARYQVEDSGGRPCAVVVKKGGRLEVDGARVELRGDFVLLEGGRATWTDSEVALQCSFPREFNFELLGGHLDSRRVTVGGRTAGAQICNFYLDAGLWTARDTVVNYSGGILMGVRNGRFGDLRRRGGTLDADGLHQGVRGDFLHLSGRGDAVLRNSAFGISMFVWDGGQSGEIPLDVPRERRIAHRVLGDPRRHDRSPTRAAVTDPIPGSPWRLELENTLVPRWNVHFFDVGAGTRARTYRLRDADAVGLSIHADDLNGAPTLVGPWRSFYPQGRALPGLPTATAPGGEHGIPPDCGIRIGSVTILSDANRWSYVTHWGLYLDGPSRSVFRIDGPMHVAEIYLWNADLTLAGTAAYDAAINATTVNVRGTARLRLENATVGSPSTAQAEIAAFGAARVELEQVKLRKLLLRTGPQAEPGPNQGIDRATISVAHVVPSKAPGEVVTTREARGGSVTFVDRGDPAARDQLYNLDFEDPMAGSTVPHWRVSGASGSSSSDRRPGAASTQVRSLRYATSSRSGSIRKTVPLPVGVGIELTGWIRGVSGSGSVTAALRGAGGREVTKVVTPSGTSWTPFLVGSFVVAAADVPVTLELAHAGATGGFTFGLDDLELRVTRWWEDDNLSNLAFEAPVVHAVGFPGGDRPPDGWALLDGIASVETADVVAGRALRIDAQGNKAVLRKNLRFVRPGQTLVFGGRVKAIAAGGGPAFRVNVQVGEGERYWDRSWSGNVFSVIDSGTGWQPFSLTYVVPSGAAKLDATVLAIHGGGPGDVLLIDECTVTVR